MLISRRATMVGAVAVGLALASCGSDDAEPLVADAGLDTVVAIGQAPSFDGCGSTGEIANYSWTILEAPESMADDAGKSLRDESTACSFTLQASMLAEEVGEWVIELTVTDADGNTESDTVDFTVVGE